MFTKTYSFVHLEKGKFRVYVSEASHDVRIEIKPNKFLSVKDMWPLKTQHLNPLKQDAEITEIRRKHLEDYERMINYLDNIETVEAQDYYMMLEMKKENCLLVQ